MEIGRSSEVNRLTGAALIGITAISLTGCGSETPIEEFPEASVTYDDKGRRITDFTSDDFADIIAFCDGNSEDGFDLVEQTSITWNGNAGAGNSMTRTAGHPACGDGVLTEADFTDSFSE